jgi:hypothetical protein
MAVGSLWQSSQVPPDNSRCVILRFDDDGQRDCEGFYWRAEGAWYKSAGSKARKAAVHPTKWRDKDFRDEC